MEDQPATSTSRRVLIVDGNLGVGRALQVLVEHMPGLRVVGLCTRGERALAHAAASTPEVALVDAELPGLCSVAVIRLLRWRLPETRIVALGIYPERRRAALEAGAHQFVLKDAGYEALQAAIAGPLPTARQPATIDAASAARNDAAAPPRRPLAPRAHQTRVPA